MKTPHCLPAALRALAFVLIPLSLRGEPISIDSPGGQFSVTFSTNENGRPTYHVRWKDREIIAPSGLGFLLDREIDLTTGF